MLQTDIKINRESVKIDGKKIEIEARIRKTVGRSDHYILRTRNDVSEKGGTRKESPVDLKGAVC